MRFITFPETCIAHTEYYDSMHEHYAVSITLLRDMEAAWKNFEGLLVTTIFSIEPGLTFFSFS